MAARQLPTVLTDEELAAVLTLPSVQTPSGLRNKAMLKAMAYGGLRVSEVVNPENARPPSPGPSTGA